MSEMEILSNTEAQHSEFRYRKMSVIVNPKLIKNPPKKHGLQMQEEQFKNTSRLNLQRRQISKELMKGGIPPKSSLPVF